MINMPWRLQLAMAAMQGDYSHDPLCRSSIADYFRNADAMLAEHERTANANNLNARRVVDKIRTAADAFRMPMFRDILNDAANELERMLNEK